jgi:hypothetical protein
MRSVPLRRGADLGSPALLYIAYEGGLLVSYNVRVLVGLPNSNVTRIICGEFLVGLDLLPSLRGTRRCPTMGASHLSILAYNRKK